MLSSDRQNCETVQSACLSNPRWAVLGRHRSGDQLSQETVRQARRQSVENIAVCGLVRHTL